MTVRRSTSILLLALLTGVLLVSPSVSASPGGPRSAALGDGPGTISGTVSDDDGGPATWVLVRLFDLATGTWVPNAKTSSGPTGHYVFAGVDVGSYQVRFGPTSLNGDPPAGPYVLEWNGGSSVRSLAPALVISGADHLVVDASLAHGGTIEGHVLRSSGAPPFTPKTVRLYEDATGIVSKAMTGTGGTYSFTSVAPGTYYLRVSDGYGMVPVWFGGTPDRASSTPVIVTAGDVTVADVVMPNTGTPPPPPPDPWSVEPSANPGNDNHLESISCTATDWCMAVGSTITTTEHALAAVWDGDVWTAVPVPEVGDEGEVLRSVSCANASACMGVGATVVDGVARTFAMRWDGTAWAHSPTPDLNERDNTFNAVSCPAVDSCVAVGTAFDDARNPSLMAIWDGAAWELVPGDDRGSWDSPNAVSCSSPTWCVAVGDLQGGDGTNGAVVQAWDGTSWSAMPGPAASAGGYIGLTGVTCMSPTSCVAVGMRYDVGYTSLVVETWNGTSWKLIITPPGPTGPFQVLEDVSCASVTNCAAVGFSATGPLGAPVTVVQVWDGIAWQTAPSAVAGVTASRLAGVSCVAATTVCRGVGWTELGARSTLVLIGDIS